VRDKSLETENFAQSILDSLQQEIVILDESGFIIQTNRSWDKSVQTNDANVLNNTFLGVNYLETCRKSFLRNKDTIAKEVLDGLEKLYNLEMENFSVEYPCHTLLKQQWILLQASRIQNSNKLVVSHTNITSQIISRIKEKEINKRLEKKIEENSEKLESLKSSLQRKMIEIIRKDSVLLEKEKEIYQAFLKERELTDFKTKLISTISHEVRTPLTNIHLSAEILRKYEKTLNAQAKEKYLDEIPKSCKRITQILENFFFIHQIESNERNFQLSSIDFKTVMEEILLDTDQLSLGSTKRIQFTGLERELMKVTLDVILIKQIIVQLLSNALKYSNEDSPVIFQFDISYEEICFSVEDFGIGIPDSDKDKIFDSFFRGSNIGNKSGVGLGLYIVKESLNLSNGRIEFVSYEKQGSIFKVYLPLGKRRIDEEDFNY